jgi:hypothetical protein
MRGKINLADMFENGLGGVEKLKKTRCRPCSGTSGQRSWGVPQPGGIPDGCEPLIHALIQRSTGGGLSSFHVEVCPSFVQNQSQASPKFAVALSVVLYLDGKRRKTP